jgi:hypothetical protein
MQERERRRAKVSTIYEQQLSRARAIVARLRGQ